jgi:hypothetical protein
MPVWLGNVYYNCVSFPYFHTFFHFIFLLLTPSPVEGEQHYGQNYCHMFRVL